MVTNYDEEHQNCIDKCISLSLSAVASRGFSSKYIGPSIVVRKGLTLLTALQTKAGDRIWRQVH